MRQRVLIVVALLVGGLVWLLAEGPLSADNASLGITLGDARVGVVPAAALAVLAGLPAIVLGVLAGVLGNPAAAPTIVAGSLCVVAAAGGGSRGWLWRADLPGGYVWLMVELVAWFLLHALSLYLVVSLREPVRARLAEFVTASRQPAVLPTRETWAAALAGGAVCAAVGGFLGYLMLKSWDGGQLVGGLLLAFGVAGVAARSVAPATPLSAVLSGPLLVGLGAYAWVLVSGSYPTGERVLSGWYTGQLPGLCIALPIHYASAGVAGCAIGFGIAGGFEQARAQHFERAAQHA